MIVNNVDNRFLPIPQSVINCLEPEPRITDFEIIRELGCGSFGRVSLAIHKKTRAKYALKAIDKKNQTNQEEKPYFRREIEIMYKVHHPNVVKLYGHFEDNKYCYFIMEYIPKGNIYDYAIKDRTKKLSVQTIAELMKDLICAVYFLHEMRPPIIHRDIKPENVLLTESMTAKLTDFGWSNYIRGASKRTTVCGTPVYLAPEIVNEQGHDERVDIWCIGVLLFELMTGLPPFEGGNMETLKNNIKCMNIRWTRDINPDAKDLISRILRYRPEDRIPLEKIITHPFFTKFFPNPMKYLIKPDFNSQYKVFVVSRDEPGTWDPIIYPVYKIPRSNTGPNIINEVERLRRQLREKDEQLTKLSRDVNSSITELEMYYDELKMENYELKEKIKHYEKHLNEKHGQFGYYNEIRESIQGNNKVNFNRVMDKLKNHFDDETTRNFNAIIRIKEREIERFKEDEKIRREREKKKYAALINKYDKALGWHEEQNKELKYRLKELQKHFY